MSTWDDLQIECPFCAHAFGVQVASGLHVSRLPQIRKRIVDGKLHRFDCPQCHRTTEVRRPLIYADFERGHWIEVWPAQDIATWRVLAADCDARYHRALERGAPMLRSHAERFRVRIVFGYDELREKVVVWDAGYDDVTVECLKLLAIRRDVSIVAAGDRILVSSISAPRITLVRLRAGEASGTFDIDVPVADLAAIRESVLPALELSDPFVSIDRVVGRHAVTAS